MEYDKPHLTFERQVELMRSRGLEIHESHHATALLGRVGYYRFSAYTYPLRALLDPEAPRESKVQYRGPDFLHGASFELAEALWRFDRRLRLTLLDALETIEVALRVQMAYVLGERSTFAHLDPAQLAPDRTGVIRNGETAYERWLRQYASAVSKAESEDFITHYRSKYDGKLPVWVATEVLDFGMSVSLFGLMAQRDQTRVAREFGVDSGRSFERWLKALNYLRNVCAHHSRLWNRILTYEIAQIPPGLAPTLEHLAAVTGRRRKKLYVAATVTAYLVETLDQATSWPLEFAALIEEFPSSPLVSPNRDMGFPLDWHSAPTWSAHG